MDTGHPSEQTGTLQKEINIDSRDSYNSHKTSGTDGQIRVPRLENIQWGRASWQWGHHGCCGQHHVFKCKESKTQVQVPKMQPLRSSRKLLSLSYSLVPHSQCACSQKPALCYMSAKCVISDHHNGEQPKDNWGREQSHWAAEWVAPARAGQLEPVPDPQPRQHPAASHGKWLSSGEHLGASTVHLTE